MEYPSVQLNKTLFDSELKNNIAKMLIEGYQTDEIAKIAGCRKWAVLEVRNTMTFQRLVYMNSMAKLTVEGVPAAIQALIEIVLNKKNSASSRVSAADKILAHTGCVVNEQGKLEKAPSQMTQAELQQRLQALQAEAGNRAQPAQTIDISPIDIANMLD